MISQAACVKSAGSEGSGGARAPAFGQTERFAFAMGFPDLTHRILAWSKVQMLQLR